MTRTTLKLRIVLAVVAAVAWLVDFDGEASVPAALRLGVSGAGLALLALLVAMSVALGLWQRRRGRTGTIPVVLNLALAIAAVPASAGLLDWVSNRQYAAAEPIVQAVATPGLTHDGVSIGNVYPFSRDGRLLLDVLLYDENGAPLNVRPGDSDALRRVLRARDGSRIYNSFPIRHFEQETRRVARPRAAPPIDWSPIVTPPLNREAPTSRGSRRSGSP